MTGVLALALASDPRPADNNVVAGWVGAVVFIALIIGVVFILRSFTRQLKKVNAADEAGVFDDKVDQAGTADGSAVTDPDETGTGEPLRDSDESNHHHRA